MAAGVNVVASRSQRAAELNLRRARLGGLLMVGLLGASLALPAVAGAAPGDIGYEGPSTVGAGTAPTGSKPQSKLWWNDLSWWASMWDADSGDFHIHRLDLASQTWVDTGVPLDNRYSTHADVLWDADAGKLYVASHRFSTSPASGYPSRLYRFSYNAATGTYTRDSGFPVSINNYRTETLVIDKDSTGQLWATWVQGDSVWVSATACAPTCDDTKWGTPFTISPSSVSADDISSLVAFGGNRIGVMWSDQRTGSDYFAVHSDADVDSVWSVETALPGPNMADDHINLKSDSSGRVYAAVKTSMTASKDPLTMLLVRSATGAWSRYVFGLVSENHSRPIVQIDEEHRVVHMFATSASGDTILTKKSSLDSISFASGIGTAVITDADGTVNDVTSAKHGVHAASGLVVAAHSTNKVYFHAFQALGDGDIARPSAGFTAEPTTGTVPLTVEFTDKSTGTIESRAWDFDDDGTVDSNSTNPAHTYSAAGTYTARLTVTNSAGSSSATETITVATPAEEGSIVRFSPTDDAYVRSGAPSKNFGADTTLRVYSSVTESYLRFTVSGVTTSVASAKLRLFVTDASPNSGSIYSVRETAWSESTITWDTRPTVGSLITGPQAAPLGTWIEFDLLAVVQGDGSYSFALKDGASAAWYGSKEGGSAPELVLTLAP